jgi:hypothetical protein
VVRQSSHGDAPDRQMWLAGDKIWLMLFIPALLGYVGLLQAKFNR